MIATRRTLLTWASAGVLLAACGAGSGGDRDDPSDMAIGSPQAPVRIVEYASVTCPHCREWHEKVWPQLKANYIDAGKVRFIFREFPTNPAELAVAGFQIARCGGKTPEQYFAMLDVLFDQQPAIVEAYENNAAKEKLIEVGKSGGVSEDQLNACLADPAGVQRIKDTVDAAEKRFKVTGTPTIIVNGKVAGADAYAYATLAKLIDAQIDAKAASG